MDNNINITIDTNKIIESIDDTIIETIGNELDKIKPFITMDDYIKLFSEAVNKATVEVANGLLNKVKK